MDTCKFDIQQAIVKVVEVSVKIFFEAPGPISVP